MSTLTLTNKMVLTIRAITANSPSMNTSSSITGLALISATKFTELVDVNVTGQVDGDTVIYRANTDTYNVETFTLDSGEF